jgi:hypothetical protein
MTILLLIAAIAALLGAVGAFGMTLGAEDRPGFTEHAPLS